MKKITWQVGEGKIHEIPEDALVTFYGDSGAHLGVSIEVSKIIEGEDVVIVRQPSDLILLRHNNAPFLEALPKEAVKDMQLTGKDPKA